MSVSFLTKTLLLNQNLTLDAEDHEALSKAVVACAGLGGIGCPALEVLARNAVGHFKLADIAHYTKENARQIYMTQQTVGKAKVEVARERVLSINPEATVDIFSKGVIPSSYRAFCKGADVIINEVDLVATHILLHYAANLFRIPMVNAARIRWPERHILGVTIYDYNASRLHFDTTILDFMNKWGIDAELFEEYLDFVRREQDCPELANKLNSQNIKFRITGMQETITKGQVEMISDKTSEYLIKVAEMYPDKFYKFAISPEEAMVMGCLAGTTAKDVILGRRPSCTEVNLYN